MERTPPGILRGPVAASIWIALITVIFFYLLSPYFAPIVWAIVLAVIFYPLRDWMEQKLRIGGVGATLVTVLVCLCIVIVPAILLLAALAGEVAGLRERVVAQQIDVQQVVDYVRGLLPKRIADWLASLDIGAWHNIRERAVEGLSGVAGGVSNYILDLGQNTALFLVAFGVMLYLLFFFLYSGRNIRDAVVLRIPLQPAFKSKLVTMLGQVIRAAVQGNVIIAVLQGAAGALTMWLLGINGALLLGALMAMFSLLPAVGAPVVWIPVAAWLALTGQWFQAITLAVVGALVIGSIDNVLRPPLVSKGAQMPDYLVFLSTIGGLSIFGITGFVLGPLIAATFLFTWKYFGSETEPKAR